ncbi:MAG: putative ras-related protein Rab-13 [Harvfovirus sp.]|uniref:Putative ras-related protein Rab-13 n=1 Tax=Harvfovirus sp. TaxID=2487768 RepID=A0A3G5A3W3_9VIRU|nr:MAG: putative ras-related protein Rab-13 [Harvfovirus sp.]
MSNFVFKFIVIGESGVGKTCLVSAYAGGGFITTHISTVGIDFMTKKVRRGGGDVKLQLWDTAGQEKYRSLTSEYMRGAHGIIIVFDVSDLKSLEKSIEIYNDIAIMHDNLRPVISLVGTKFDIIEEAFRLDKKLGEGVMKYVMRGVERIKINHFAWDQKIGVVPIKIFWTSAKTEYGLRELFDYMVDRSILTQTVGYLWHPYKAVVGEDPVIIGLREEIAHMKEEIVKVGEGSGVKKSRCKPSC